MPDFVGTIHLHVALPDPLNLRHQTIIALGAGRSQRWIALSGCISAARPPLPVGFPGNKSAIRNHRLSFNIRRLMSNIQIPGSKHKSTTVNRSKVTDTENCRYFLQTLIHEQTN
jgi:hypothetical protein